MRESKSFSLPFNIELEIVDECANIESELGRALAPYTDDLETARKVGVIEGIEHLLMSLARAGVDLSRPEFAVAIRDCVANLQQ